MRALAIVACAGLAAIGVGVTVISETQATPSFSILGTETTTAQNRADANTLALQLMSLVRPPVGSEALTQLSYPDVQVGYQLSEPALAWTVMVTRFWRLRAPLQSIDSLIPELGPDIDLPCASGNGGLSIYSIEELICFVKNYPARIYVLVVNDGPSTSFEVAARAVVPVSPGRPAAELINFRPLRVVIRDVDPTGVPLDAGTIVGHKAINNLVATINSLPTASPPESESCNIEVGPTSAFPQVDIYAAGDVAPAFVATIDPCGSVSLLAGGQEEPGLLGQYRLVPLVVRLAPNETRMMQGK